MDRFRERVCAKARILRDGVLLLTLAKKDLVRDIYVRLGGG